jgi:hypothetical protein
MTRYTFGKTLRGFSLIEFEDHNAQACTIQKSSIATKDLVWMGIGENRMHISQSDARKIAKILLHFAETGDLPEKMKDLPS